MRRLYLCAALAVVLLPGGGCHKGMVRLSTSPESNRYEWREPISRAVFHAPSEVLYYVVQAPLGYARGRQQLMGGFVLNVRLRWNDAVRPLSYHFDRLAERFNAAQISITEFDQRRDEIMQAVAALTDQKAELDRTLATYQEEEAALLQTQDKELEARLVDYVQAVCEEADAIVKQAAARTESLGGAEAAVQVLLAPGLQDPRRAVAAAGMR